MIIRRSRLYLFFCFCFIFGVVIGFWLNGLIVSLWFWLYTAVLINIVWLILGWSSQKVRIISCGLIFLLTGIVRFGWTIQNNIEMVSYHNRPIEFFGQIVLEPERRESNERLTMGRISLDGVNKLAGRVLVYGQKYGGYRYGDWLKVECVLQTPTSFDGFDYPGFLASKKVFSICYNPVIEPDNHDLSWWQEVYRVILGFKDRSKAIIDRLLDFPQSEILSAFLLGIRSGIPKDVQDNFSKAGTSHILAISGLHITILCGLLVNLILAMGLDRKRSFWLAVVIMTMFLLMIGFGASSFRAGLMGFLLMLSLKEGRLLVSINGLLMVASVLLLINPLLLFWDVGFQLSFAAVLGIIYLGSWFNKVLTKIHIPEVLEIRSSLVMTLSAQIFVLPLVLYYFGRLSIISPMANILILPILPWLLMGGLMMVLVGLVWLGLAQVVGWLVNFGILYVLVVTRWVIQVPCAYMDFKINWLIVGLTYGLIGILLVYLKSKPN